MPVGNDRPRYNEYIIARELDVDSFAADADFIVTQDVQGVRAFQVPNLPGRPGTGFALLLVAVDSGGAPVTPGTITADVEVLEVVRYSGEYNDRAPHVCEVESLTTPLTPLAFTLPANLVARLPDVGGAQNQFLVRVSALANAPAGGTVRILAKPLGG